MTVNPGFAGKRIVKSTINKVLSLKKYLDEKGLNIDIEVDGNISLENAEILYKNGANVFVAGSSSLFKNMEKSILNIIDEMRKVIGW